MRKNKKLLSVILAMTIMVSMFSFLTVSTSAATGIITTFNVGVGSVYNTSSNSNKTCSFQVVASSAYSVGITIYLEKTVEGVPNAYEPVKAATKVFGNVFTNEHTFSGVIPQGVYRFRVIAYANDKNGNVLQTDTRSTPAFTIK